MRAVGDFRGWLKSHSPNPESFTSSNKLSQLSHYGEDALHTLSHRGEMLYGFMGRCCVPEANPCRMFWSCVVALILIYTGTVFPYRLCFLEFKLPTPAPENKEWLAFEFVIDILFWVDLCINFFFTYKDSEGREVHDLKRIACRYLRTYFFVNLIACIPPEAVGYLIKLVEERGQKKDATINKGIRLIRLQRMSRLARLARLSRLMKVVSFMQDNAVWDFVQTIRGVRVLNFFFGLLWSVHLLACGWYLCASLHDDPQETWLARRVLGVDAETGEPRTLIYSGSWEQWWNAMYFVLTVFTTVGFGDISAVTTGEIAYVCFTMMIGAVVHSIVISEIIGAVTHVDQQAVNRSKQKENMIQFARETELGDDMRRKLTSYTRSRKMIKLSREGYDRDLLERLFTTGMMSHDLMMELPGAVYGGKLLKNSFISGPLKYQVGIPLRFPLTVTLALHQRHYGCGELVYFCFDHPFHIYLVHKGTFAYVGRPEKTGGISELSPTALATPRHASGMSRTLTSLSLSEADEALKVDEHVELDVGKADEESPRLMSKKLTHSKISQDGEETPRLMTKKFSQSKLAQDGAPVIDSFDGSSLYPYQLFGHGTYFGEIEILLDHRPRHSCVRCETRQESTLLALHKKDLAGLIEEYPHYGWVWRTTARRRESHRKMLLARLTHGQNFKVLAATTIQRWARANIQKSKKSIRRSVTLSTLNNLCGSALDLGTRNAMFNTEKHEAPKYAQHLAHDVEDLRSDLTKLQGSVESMKNDISQVLQMQMAFMKQHAPLESFGREETCAI